MNLPGNPVPVTQAVVLVGGRGTRLGSLTDAMPKPMLPIGDRPFVDYLLAFLAGQGVREVLLCVGYLAERFEQHFAGRQPFGLSVAVHREPAPAGTGGALALARARLADTFYALNGDTIFTAKLPELASMLRAGPQALGALALRQVEDAARFGAVRLAGDRVAGFAEKSVAGPGCISGGIYCLKREALDLLPPPPCSLETDLFPALAARNALLGRKFDGYFLDIGLPETLARGQAELPKLFPLPPLEQPTGPR
jgi:NDP-sugar pyrophosphorylase family protein